MSLNIGDNFSYLGKKFLDSREGFDTLEAMNSCTSVPEGFITYCKETSKRYEYKNEKWIEYSPASGGGSTFTTLGGEGETYVALPSDFDNDVEKDYLFKNVKLGDITFVDDLVHIYKNDSILEIIHDNSWIQYNIVGDTFEKVQEKTIAYSDEIPTKISDLTNDGNYVTQDEVSDLVTQEIGSSMDDVNNTLQTHETNINKILEVVDEPPTFTNPTLSISLNKTTIEHNVATDIVINPTFRQNDGGEITGYLLKKGDITLVDSSSTQSYTDNVTIYHGSSVTYTATVNYGKGESKTSTFGIVYEGLSEGYVTSNATSRAYANSYYGVIDGDSIDDLSVLTSRLGTSKGYTITYAMTNQRSVYAYPKSFGALTSIKDANNFEYINSYTRSELTYNDVDYYVYVLTDPVTITEFKQIFN